jgi:hypothetical protein
MSLTKVSGSMIQGYQVTPEEFGCVGNGVTDDSAAMAAACDYCSQTGASLWMSPKFYKSARVEVHGTYTVHGNGATVQYLGVGQTIISGTGTGTAAVPTPWPNDPSFSPSYPATTQYTLTVAPSKGATTITLASVTGIVAGMYLFIAGNPTASSTPTNYIPSDFEFVQVESVADNVVTLQQPLQSAYLTTQSGVFYTPGLAIHCTVNDLNIYANSEAYQAVIRSSFACTFNNILFSGVNNPGAATFSDNLVMSNITIEGNDAGGLSTGRGIVCATYTNIHNKNYIVSSGFSAFFVEESFYKITVNNLISTGILAGGSVAISGNQRPRTLTFNDCIINSNAYGGLFGAFTFGTFQGVDVIASNCVFQGAVVTPNSGNYPSITGDAMVWMSSNLAGDLVTFQNCKFISANVGNTWPSAIGGFAGTVRFDALCEFVTCTVPTQIIPVSEKGAWTPIVFGATTVGTTTYTQQDGAYSREGNAVTVTFEVVWSAASGTGNVKIGGLPFVADVDNFGIVPIYTGTVAIANAVGFKVIGASNTALGYAAITATGQFVGVISYII